MRVNRLSLVFEDTNRGWGAFVTASHAWRLIWKHWRLSRGPRAAAHARLRR